MMQHKKCSIIEIFTQSPALQQIVRKVEQLANLNRIIHQNLDPELATQCRVANIREGILIISTGSPALGHLLRFAKIELLETLRRHPEWCHLKAIEIQVQPPRIWPEKPTSAMPPRTLSRQSCEALKNSALGISAVPLQRALLAITRR
jgi:hypothetical protein